MTDTNQHRLYCEAGDKFAPAIARLSRAMERDPDRARELEQDIHCELFHSLARFEGRSSLKTWVFRVAHNVAAEHRLRASRRPQPVALEDIAELPVPGDAETMTGEALAVARAMALVRQLPTLDAQVFLLWLEGESAGDIADVTGLGASAVATRVHRLKSLIAGHFNDQSGENQ
ncbi:MAG: RNA polymerase sigma factor [Erythrobacter sp.]